MLCLAYFYIFYCNRSADGAKVCSLTVSRDFQLFLFKDIEYFIVTVWAHWTVLICLLVFLTSLCPAYEQLHTDSLSSWIMVWRDLPRGGLSESDWVAGFLWWCFPVGGPDLHLSALFVRVFPEMWAVCPMRDTSRQSHMQQEKEMLEYLWATCEPG